MKKMLPIALVGSLAVVAAAAAVAGCSGSAGNNGNNPKANTTTVVAPATNHSHEPGTAAATVAPRNDNATTAKPGIDNREATKPSPPDHGTAPGTTPHNFNDRKKP